MKPGVFVFSFWVLERRNMLFFSLEKMITCRGMATAGKVGQVARTFLG